MIESCYVNLAKITKGTIKGIGRESCGSSNDSKSVKSAIAKLDKLIVNSANVIGGEC